MIVGPLILRRNSMKGGKITHMWADFSLKTGLSGFTSVSLIRERERRKGWGGWGVTGGQERHTSSER